MPDKLKPCPFCGSRADFWVYGRDDVHAVYCTGDGNCPAGIGFVSNKTRSEAVSVWNRRAGEDKD